MGILMRNLWTTLYDGAFKWTHPLKYGTVGKRQYRATVTEDYGKQGISPLVQTDVLNYAPEANFNVFGITQQPGKDEDSGPPITAYTPVSIFRSWTLKNPYTGGNGDKVSWKINITNSSIATKNGIMANFNSRLSEFREWRKFQNEISIGCRYYRETVLGTERCCH